MRPIITYNFCKIPPFKLRFIILRYVDENGDIKEKFVRMAECLHGVDGEGLSKIILESIDKVNLDMEMCRGQGYDGAGKNLCKFTYGKSVQISLKS